MKKIVMKKIDEIWEDCDSAGVAIITSLAIVLAALAIAFGLMCFQAWLVMLLWNWVAVDLFGLPAIGFWMAYCLRWLCGLLFRSSSTSSND